MEIELRAASIVDAVALAPRMREADRNEVAASHGLSPIGALVNSVVASREPMAALADGEVMALFGICECRDFAMPWLMGATGIERFHVPFLRRSRAWVQEAHRRYPLLMNWVDARNKASIRWLGWLGFTIYDPEPYGLEGRPFHRFEMR